MDASASGNPWYPPACICCNIVRVWWLLYAGHRAVFEVHRIYFIRRFRSVSGDVGCLHMPVGLRIEDFPGSSGESYAFVIAYE